VVRYEDFMIDFDVVKVRRGDAILYVALEVTMNDGIVDGQGDLESFIGIPELNISATPLDPRAYHRVRTQSSIADAAHDTSPVIIKRRQLEFHGNKYHIVVNTSMAFNWIDTYVLALQPMALRTNP